LAPTSPPQGSIGAPLSTIGPVRSGLVAASSSVAQPPWQLPMTQGLGAAGCWRVTSRTNSASARVTSAIVWPGCGSRRKATKQTGWPAASATPTWLSVLNPPIPGPCPARGSMMMKGRLVGSMVMSAGGRIRSSM